jgi:peptidoglycan/LPS O-acetylase OafA/YrhL
MTATQDEQRGPAALAPPPGHPRFPLFDGLRAIAAIAVLLFHAGFNTNAEIGTSGFAPYIARLNVGVAIFFVISGFLLYRPMLAARKGLGPASPVRSYARRRLLRILPGYWVALTLLAIWPGLSDVFTGHWYWYYGFLQGYGNVEFFGGISAAWTLGCEVVFYAALPLWAKLFARRSWRLELAVLMLLAAASTWWRAEGTLHPRTYLQPTILGTFLWFALGMGLAIASVELHGRDRLIRRSAWLGWPLAVVAFIVLCRGLGLYSGFPFQEHDSVAQAIAVYLLSGVVAIGLALPAAFEQPGPIGRALAWKPVAWLGLISYGIYLYHASILSWIYAHLGSHLSHTRGFIELVAIGLPVSLLAGAASYYLVERPALRFKESSWRRSRSSR